MKEYKIPVIPGDGVGPEVIREGKKVIDAVAPLEGFKVEWIHFPQGTDHYLKTGEIISEKTLEELGKYRALYVGAIGDPRVEPGLVDSIIVKIRFAFDQYVNYRIVKLLEGVPTPLKNKGPKDIDFVAVRENVEDFYIRVGARAHKGTSNYQLPLVRKTYRTTFNVSVQTDAEEIGFHIGAISREGSRRIIKYGFELARKTGKTRVSVIDKANVLPEMYNLWREVAAEVAKDYPGIEMEFMYADAATMWFVKNPEHFQVVVAPNLFGDILTDLAAAISGGMGLAPGANLNPDGTSMFEPIHGSAPKYTGQNIVNPIATVWAGALMLDYLGEPKAARRITKAIEIILKAGKIKTRDLGGAAKTFEMGDALATEAVK
ncbi:MAG: isocitrate/isopropylmalate dehydrogenase family protein [Deltaproteobacteria bacterium]|nr:isocitrate/isopropylmalate dehydrogenase family protein [Deltaproteobacteria bacterium]